MLKQSKTQISLVVTLGLMIIGQMGFSLYKSYSSRSSFQIMPKKKIARAGSAKSFGLTLSEDTHFCVSSVRELDQVFDNCDYTLTKTKTKGEVPRLYLAKLPKDMKRKKKSSNFTFIQVLLPHILKVNEQILSDRNRLLEMQKRQKGGHTLRPSEKIWIMKLASEYRCKSTKIESLLKHVDIIPPSLALAQGILETGGGRSPAALTKNSTFGHMATKTKVAKFESLHASVKAYALNLNRHSAYAHFRKTRASLRTQNQKLCGIKLASCLLKYSERGTAYTRDLQDLIRKRGLGGYDEQHVRLKP